MKFNPQKLLITLPIVLCSCITMHKPHLSDYQTKFAPPGTVKIGSNLYYDETENRNLDYLEYVFWNKKVFGPESDEYKSALPDTLVWNKLKNWHCKDFDKTYLRHPSNSSYPVVGVAMQQAEAYSKWRSDRVFEFMLIGFGKLKLNQNLNKDNYFTIEKYFKGEYNNIKPDTSVHYVPYYHLPDLNEWKLALKFNDSLVKVGKIMKCNEPKCLEVFPEYGENKCPTRTVHSECAPKGGLFNLIGNVREWSYIDSIAYGGSWYDKPSTVAKQDTFVTKTANAYTGFRDAFRWVDVRDVKKK